MSDYIYKAPVIILPKRGNGIEWIGKRKLLIYVLNDESKLIWVSGGNCWDGRGMPQKYYPGELKIFTKESGYLGKDIKVGGRLTRAILNDCKAIISQRLKLTIKQLEELSPQNTLLIGSSRSKCYDMEQLLIKEASSHYSLL